MFNRQRIERVGFEEALRQMPTGVMIVEAPAGEIVSVNRQAQVIFERYVGRSIPSELGDLRELHDSGVYRTFYPDGQPYEMDQWPLIRSIRDGEEVRDEDIIHLPAEGSQFTLRCSSSPIRDDQGRIVAAVAVFSDVTEQRQAEEALGESNRQIENILESITDEFFATDRQWCFTYINERALNSLRRIRGEGLTRQELLGENCWEAFPELMDTVFCHKYHEAVREQRTMRFEAYSPLSDRWIEVHAYPSEEGLSVYAREITRRKRAEEKIRGSEERFRLLVEGVKDYAIYMLDPNGYIESWNEGARRIKGYDREEILGQHFSVFYPPEDVEHGKPEQGLREAEAEGTYEEEGWRVRKDGARFWASVLITALWDEAGYLRGFSKVTRDTTEQKRAEEALRESNRRNEDILESVTDGFYAMDRDWRFTYLNARAVRFASQLAGKLAGEEFTHEGLLGRTLWETLPATVGTKIEEEYRRAVREQQATVFEYPYPGGSQVFEVHAYPSEQGLSVYFRDITERKRAEEQLAQQAGLMENMQDGVLVADEHFVVVTWNKGAEEMLGWTAQEVLGSDAFEAIPMELTQDQRAEIHRELSETGRWRDEVMVYHRDGTPIYVDSLTIALRGEDGRTTGYLSINRDVTERKQAEKEIQTRTYQQAAVAELGVRALVSDDLQALMDEAVTLVARTLGVEYTKIVEPLPGGERMLLRAGVGWEEDLVGRATESASPESEAGYAMRCEEPVVVEDVHTDTRFEPSELIREHEIVSGMTAVIHGREDPLGVLCALSASRRNFSEDDTNFLQAVANVLAMAIERKEAQERLEEVRETERSRIARDLHDEALQDLTDALVEAQLARATPPEDPTLPQRLEMLVAALDRVGPQLRGAIYDLRLREEQDRPFSELLEGLVRLQNAMAPQAEVRLELGDEVLSEPLGQTGREVLRIVKEALTNARRHSGAQNVRVAVRTSEEEDKLLAEVEDDGRGFEPGEEGLSAGVGGATGGAGIRGMGERARLLGGELKVESEPGQGTKVSLKMPLHKGTEGQPQEEEEESEEEEQKVRILLVDDHTAIREALAGTLQTEASFEVVGQAGSLAEARRMLEEVEQVDVAIVDLGLPDGYGGDLIGELREANPQVQVLVLSASLDRAEIARSVERGAAGVLHKSAHLDEVVETVKRLRRGETLLPLEEVVKLLRFAGIERRQEYEARQAIASLTPREREVLQH